MKWEPIESAPELTSVLVFLDGSIFEGYKGVDGNWSFPYADAHGCGCCAGEADFPTHWAALPEPPEGQ